VESVENQTQVFHAFHRPLKIPQQRQDFHISTAPGVRRLEKWKTQKRFPTFPPCARDDDDQYFSELKNPRKDVGRSAASPFSPAPTRSFTSRSTFMLILQLENADLTLTGASYETRGEVDPYFLKSQAAALVRSYLGEADPKNPLASPLYGNLAGLPAIRIHVGDDEVLLDDSRRFVERAVAAGVDATLDVWMGMAHGFTNAAGRMNAADQALDSIGAFLTERLEGAH
jgi:hypothetical protein